MTPSAEVESFIKGWEKCKLKPYQDSGGKWTAGWGTLLEPDEHPSVIWTQEKADGRFAESLAEIAQTIERMLPSWILQQHEFDALVSFAYNKGLAALQNSTMLKHIKAGKMGAAAAEFTKWENVKGQLNHGVLRRSCAEQAIFLARDYMRRP